MSGWDGYGGQGSGTSGSGAEHGPSEEQGRAPWHPQEPAPPPWASAETQTGGAPPPPWPYAETRSAEAPPPPWPPPAPPAGGVPGQPRPPAAYGPAGASPRRMRAMLLGLVMTAVVGAGAGAGVWYLTRADAPGTIATPPATAPVTATRTADGTAPGAGAGADPGTGSGAGDATPQTPRAAGPDGPDEPPAGYRRALDPVGYALDVPEGWTRRQKQGEKAPVVFYDSPGDGRQLQIFALSEPTPAQSLDLAENDPGYGFSRQPGYRPLERTSGATWAELTYRYDDAGLGARHVVDHRFQAVDGTLYAIRASGPESLAAAAVRAPLTEALRSFCPTGSVCAP
ncbi:hypothetical protein I3F54_12110 [Streptomyces sp. MUM 2J]|nr:hypothetical protein [Streptomyces sp. MUM 2J]